MSNIIYHLPSLANIYAKINWSGGVKESNLWIFKISVGNKYSVGVEKQRSEKSAAGQGQKVPCTENYKVIFDNWFSTLPMLIQHSQWEPLVQQLYDQIA